MNVMSKLGLDDAARHGFDADRLGRIAPFLQARYLDTGKLPHAQLLIAHEGEIVHFSHQGTARAGDSEGSGSPVDEASIFRIASMTKPVTSLAFMMLVEEGCVARVCLVCGNAAGNNQQDPLAGDHSRQPE